MILIPASPISTTRGVALVSGGGRSALVECDVPSYPLTDEARDFRRARKDVDDFFPEGSAVRGMILSTCGHLLGGHTDTEHRSNG